jgi:hypothetical protein
MACPAPPGPRCASRGHRKLATVPVAIIITGLSRLMSLTTPRTIALCIVAHALFALLAGYWLYINIVVILVAICSWPFWWAVLGYRDLRSRPVYWSLAIGSALYLPCVRIIMLMLRFAR